MIYPNVFNGKSCAGILVFYVGALVAMPHIGRAQNPQALRREEQSKAPKVLPTEMIQQVKALGKRMRAVGREESIYDGQFVVEAGDPKRMRVEHQISGVLRVENLDEKTDIIFDGDVVTGVRDRSGESLVDTFVLDTPEGVIYALRNGASAQLLGRGFSPFSITAGSATPHFDIYEITALERTHPGSEMRTRRYYFDSETGILSSTRYLDRSGVAVESRFSVWTEIDGSLYPSRIERYEDGHRTFAFVASSISGRSKQAETKSK